MHDQNYNRWLSEGKMVKYWYLWYKKVNSIDW